MLKKIKIKNFKGIDSLELNNLKEINQVVGMNGSGKTSIAKAIEFLFKGTQRDKHFIRDGEQTAEVSGEFITKAGSVVSFSRSLDKNTKKAKAPVIEIDGVESATNTKLFQDYFGIGSFSPREILEEDKRNKVFANLVNSKFVFPKEIKKNFPEAIEHGFISEEIEDEGNPIKTLNTIKKGLVAYRLQAGRDKRQKENASNEALDMYKSKTLELQRDPGYTDKEFSMEDLREQEASVKLNVSKAKEFKNKKLEARENLELTQETLIKAKEKLLEAKEKVLNLENRVEMRKEELSKLEAQIVNSDESKLFDIRRQINFQNKKNDLLTYKELYEKKLEEKKVFEEKYQKINSFISGRFSSLYAPYVAPLSEKIKGLSYDDGVGFLYNGSKIENLSTAESIDLSLKMIEAQSKKTNVVIIDDADLIDTEKAKALSLKTEGTSYFLMKIEKPFEDLDSKKIQLEKKETKPEIDIEIDL